MELAEVRLTRQRLLNRADPPQLWSVLDEAALRRAVGGPAIMRVQLNRLIEVSRLPNVKIQIILHKYWCASRNGQQLHDLGVRWFGAQIWGLAW